MVEAAKPNRRHHRNFEVPNGSVESWLEPQGSDIVWCYRDTHTSGGGRWRRCEVNHCLGEAAYGRRCFHHAPIAAWGSIVKRQRVQQGFVSFRGTQIDHVLLQFITRLMQTSQEGELISLFGADILAPLQLEKVKICCGIDFGLAQVWREFSSEEVEFLGPVTARGVHCQMGVDFTGSHFYRDVNLCGAHMEAAIAGFDRCVFEEAAIFDHVTGMAISLRDTQIGKRTSIAEADLGGIFLTGADVKGHLIIRDTRACNLHWQALHGGDSHGLRPLTRNGCFFTNSVFGAQVAVDIFADEVDLSDTLFIKGGLIKVDTKKIHIKQLRSQMPLRLEGPRSPEAPPCIPSLEGADVGSLTLANLDLRNTFFSGAHDLGGLVLETGIHFNKTPKPWMARRQCVLEEYVARNSYGKKQPVWEPPSRQLNEDGHSKWPATSCEQVVAVYRELRRGFEMRLNQPDAADFYFGEMEMRRLAKSTAWSERLIIGLYRLVSGYGLRASRALMLFSLLIIGTGFLGAYLFTASNTHSYWEGVLFALYSSIPGLHYSNSLTAIGQVMAVLLHLIAPVLLVLAILALRGRVKR